MELPAKLIGEQPLISVLLSDNHEGEFKNFRCVICGGIVFSYNNETIRMILPSGKPETGRAQKFIECRAALTLNRPQDLYDLLYGIVDAVWKLENLDDVRALVAHEAAKQGTKKTVTCGARYYVS